MAIRIPSKNIYSISNPKVRDNAIDKIEIESNKISPKNEYGVAVYDQKTKIRSFDYNTPQFDLEYALASYSNANYRVAKALAYVSIEPTYVTIKSLIPITSDNRYIKEILTGVDNEGNSKINYTLVGYKITGSAVGKCDVGQGILVNDYQVYDIGYSGRIFGQEEQLTLPNIKEEVQQDATASGSISTTVTAKVVLDNSQSDIERARFTKVTIDGKDYFETTITYLCALRITKLSGAVSNLDTTIDYTLSLSGTYEEYYPTEIQITFSGNTFGISVAESTVVVGNGTNKPYSIARNELIQDGNIYDGENATNKLYSSTLNEYLNGKETAVIHCNIDDYYDYDSKEKVISANGHNILNSENYDALYNATYSNGKVSQASYDEAIEFTFQIQAYNDTTFYKDLNSKTITKFGRIALPFMKDDNFTHLRFKLNGATQDTAILFDISNLINGNVYCFSAEVVDENGINNTPTQGEIAWKDMQLNIGSRAQEYEHYGLPMTFNIYDKVIPMVYSVDGNDYPLSRNSDGTPKVFQIIDGKIYTKGQVYQDLTLQEVHSTGLELETLATLVLTEGSAQYTSDNVYTLNAQDGDLVNVYYNANGGETLKANSTYKVTNEGIIALQGYPDTNDLNSMFFGFDEIGCIGVIYLNSKDGSTVGNGSCFFAMKSTEAEAEDVNYIKILGFEVVKT